MADLTRERRPSVVAWVVAAVAAVLLHGGVAVPALTRVEPDDTEIAMGAPAIEIGVEMTAPHTESNDLPPGVLAEDSAASPALPEQQAKVENTTLPPDKPTDTHDLDRLVTDKPVKKPDEIPKPETVQSKASVESIASEAAAPPPSETSKEAPRSVAPVQGTGDSDRKVIVTWQRQLVAYLDRHKRYPKGAPPRDETIVVTFTIDRLGHVLSAQVTRSSGNRAFDTAALAMMHRADPVPPPPALLADDGLTFSIPVIFQSKGR